MDLMKLAAGMLGDKVGGGADGHAISDALGGLLGGKGGGGFDLGSIVSGLGGIAKKFL
jgi:hypothetical protein